METTPEMAAALDRAGLDMEMRAIAESAMSRLAASGAEGPDPVVVAEESAAQADAAADNAGTGGMDCAPLPFDASGSPPVYQPKSPFRLKFSFGSDGSCVNVEMEDPDFIWCDSYEYETGKWRPRAEMKTAGVGSLSLTGTVYLNITLGDDDKYSSSSVDMSASGDMSIKLYVLSNGKVMKDYRHALITLLGVAGGGGGISASGTVVMSVDYVNDSEDSDFDAHPYAIRIKRGTLAVVNGELKPVEDPNLKQFIDTVAHTASMDATSGSSAS